MKTTSRPILTALTILLALLIGAATIYTTTYAQDRDGTGSVPVVHPVYIPLAGAGVDFSPDVNQPADPTATPTVVPTTPPTVVPTTPPAPSPTNPPAPSPTPTEEPMPVCEWNVQADPSDPLGYLQALAEEDNLSDEDHAYWGQEHGYLSTAQHRILAIDLHTYFGPVFLTGIIGPDMNGNTVWTSLESHFIRDCGTGIHYKFNNPSDAAQGTIFHFDNGVLVNQITGSRYILGFSQSERPHWYNE